MLTVTAAGRKAEVEFSLYPALTRHAEVDLELELRRAPGPGNVVLSAGFGVSIGDGRMEFASHALERFEAGDRGNVQRRPAAAYLDTAQWHRYRLERRPGGCRVLVDGRQVLAGDDPVLRQRVVRFGAGGEPGDALARGPGAGLQPGGLLGRLALERPRRLPPTSSSATVRWCWITPPTPATAPGPNSADGTIVIADYTSDRFEGINAGGPQPVLKAYRVREEDLA